MSFPIPEPFCWDESFKVFYQDLDDEHKVLFNGVFECANDRGSKAKLDTLYGNVDKHFKNEEGKFSKYKYEHEKAHKAAHDEFLGKLKGLSLPLSDDSVHYAKNWLVQHIKTIDFKYKGKLE